MFIQESCEAFSNKLASKAPIPGGGGAAALVGALAAALSSMVANLTLGKKKYEAVQPEMSELLFDTEILRHNLMQLVEEDAMAFEELIQAYKMPKTTEDELSAYKQVLSEKSIEAAEVPWKIAELCGKVLLMADRAAEFGNTQAVSDAAVSALLARAALRSACYNVRINLNTIDDALYVENRLMLMEELQKRAELQEIEVLKKTDKILAKN